MASTTVNINGNNIEIEIPDGYYVTDSDHKVTNEDLVWDRRKLAFEKSVFSDEGDFTAKDKWCCIAKCNKDHPPHGYVIVPRDSDDAIQKSWKWFSACDWEDVNATAGHRRSHKKGIYAKPIVENTRRWALPKGYELVKDDEHIIGVGWMWRQEHSSYWNKTDKVGDDRLSFDNNNVYCKPIVVEKVQETADVIPDGYKKVIGSKDTTIMENWLWFNTYRKKWSKTTKAGEHTSYMKNVYAKPIVVGSIVVGSPVIATPINITPSVPKGYELIDIDKGKTIQDGWKWWDQKKKTWYMSLRIGRTTESMLMYIRPLVEKDDFVPDPPADYELADKSSKVETGWLFLLEGKWTLSSKVGKTQDPNVTYVKPIEKVSKSSDIPEGYKRANKSDLVQEDWLWFWKGEWIKSGRVGAKQQANAIYVRPIVKIGERKDMKIKKQIYKIIAKHLTASVEIPFGYYVVQKMNGEEVKVGDKMYSSSTKKFSVFATIGHEKFRKWVRAIEQHEDKKGGTSYYMSVEFNKAGALPNGYFCNYQVLRVEPKHIAFFLYCNTYYALRPLLEVQSLCSLLAVLNQDFLTP